MREDRVEGFWVLQVEGAWEEDGRDPLLRQLVTHCQKERKMNLGKEKQNTDKRNNQLARGRKMTGEENTMTEKHLKPNYSTPCLLLPIPTLVPLTPWAGLQGPLLSLLLCLASLVGSKAWKKPLPSPQTPHVWLYMFGRDLWEGHVGGNVPYLHKSFTPCLGKEVPLCGGKGRGTWGGGVINSLWNVGSYRGCGAAVRVLWLGYGELKEVVRLECVIVGC